MARSQSKELAMSSRRAKIAASATVLGLGGLAGVALESNHGVPTQLAQAGKGGSAPVVTTASGATQPASQATAGEAPTTRPPIVTRASGSGASRSLSPVDD
jgi:hypothetical protein